MSLYTKKFFTDFENVDKTFAKYGVAVIPNILDESESDMIVSQLWGYFEHVSANWETPINRNDSTSWQHMRKLVPFKHMLYKYAEAGHTQASWNVRQNKKVAEVFAKIYDVNVNELICSFDGFSFLPPPEETHTKKKVDEWFHVDHSYTRPEFECIQGWVTGTDVAKGDATLVVLAKSHKLHSHFQDAFNITDTKNQYNLSDKELNFYLENSCKMKKIRCSKGSLVIWDSRVVHCGMPPDIDRTTTNTRAIVYVSYEPRSRLTKKMQEKRIKAFENLKTTTHWAAKPILISRFYRYSKPLDINIIPRPIVTEFGRKLVGY
jgi:ectoine hydroxylase-related dioxygenase (phytanoyl-CoA dioxygenase family)